MPPPNVTGQLHMGHAVDNTMQDILIRTKRMQGYAALWVPGTDHASIATEAKVVEAMRAEGLTKEMVGRDGFLERAWAWKTKYGNRIVSSSRSWAAAATGSASASPWTRAALRLSRKSLSACTTRAHLPRQPHGQLVPPLQHLHFRRRGGV